MESSDEELSDQEPRIKSESIRSRAIEEPSDHEPSDPDPSDQEPSDQEPSARGAEPSARSRSSSSRAAEARRRRREAGARCREYIYIMWRALVKFGVHFVFVFLFADDSKLRFHKKNIRQPVTDLRQCCALTNFCVRLLRQAESLPLSV